jgi:hypothetical protein
MTEEKAILNLEYIRDHIPFIDAEMKESINLSIESLKKSADIKKYGSEMAALIAKNEEWEKGRPEREKRDKEFWEKIGRVKT